MLLVKVLSVLALGASLLAPPAAAWWTTPPYAFYKIETPRWMAWHAGLDLFGTTEGATQPNVLIHVAEVVHTPVGSAASSIRV